LQTDVTPKASNVDNIMRVEEAFKEELKTWAKSKTPPAG
jgi:hypothetical protein